MVELGISMIAICLPTLRPLFAGFSPWSIIRNVRSKKHRSTDNTGHSSVKRGATRLGSESSNTGIRMDSITPGGRSHEGIVTRFYGGQQPWLSTEGQGPGRIKVEMAFSMSHEQT